MAPDGAGHRLLELCSRLPVPEGRDPFLDEIVAALEAAKVTLAAVGRSAEGAQRFEREPVAAAA